MADIQQIVEAIATLLRTIPDLTVYTEPPGTVDTPAAVVLLGPGTYDTTMSRGTDDMGFVLDVFESSTSPQGMQNLYAYLAGSGSKSIVAKFHSDPQLGGVVQFAEVTGWEKPDRVEIGDSEYYHVEITGNAGVLGAVA